MNPTVSDTSTRRLDGKRIARIVGSSVANMRGDTQHFRWLSPLNKVDSQRSYSRQAPPFREAPHSAPPAATSVVAYLVNAHFDLVNAVTDTPPVCFNFFSPGPRTDSPASAARSTGAARSPPPRRDICAPRPVKRGSK
jgi:hypothetical protein